MFDSNGILTPGIVHTLGTSQIIVNIPGDYEVTFSVSGTEPNQFALFLNGSLVAGTIYGSGAGTQQNNGQAIIAIVANDVLTLRNHSSAAVGLASVIGGTQANVNASIVIKMLNLNG
ncbi:collagen-like protein [Sporosarcina psychrophila]|uniref:BclA C-terminal domain-containing protein n=1 Tax=Sporosarcina psychrophila TaxID=1476 RepID=A0ABV2K622_SPOPS